MHTLGEQDQARALIVRMNYVLDFPHYFVESTTTFFCLAARKLRVLCRSLGPVFEQGRYQEITPGWHMQFKQAYVAHGSPWRRALACTLRNFVHLVGLKLDPSCGPRGGHVDAQYS